MSSDKTRGTYIPVGSRAAVASGVLPSRDTCTSCTSVASGVLPSRDTCTSCTSSLWPTVLQDDTASTVSGFPIANVSWDLERLFREALIDSSLNYQSKKKAKCYFALSFIFNHLSVIENGGTSLCRGNSELIRVSLGKLHSSHPWFVSGRKMKSAIFIFITKSVTSGDPI